MANECRTKPGERAGCGHRFVAHCAPPDSDRDGNKNTLRTCTSATGVAQFGSMVTTSALRTKLARGGSWPSPVAAPSFASWRAAPFVHDDNTTARPRLANASIE